MIPKVVVGLEMVVVGVVEGLLVDLVTVVVSVVEAFGVVTEVEEQIQLTADLGSYIDSH